MQGAKWEPKTKEWRVNNVRRNNFNIAYLEEQNPFKRYTADVSHIQVRTHRNNYRRLACKLYNHQLEMVQHMLGRRQCIVAGEMGTGKTLAWFEAYELSGVKSAWYVGPKPAIASVKLEAWNWNFRGNVRYMTYDELKKVITEWKAGDPPPPMVFFDECSRVKTPDSQRSIAAFHLAEAMRDTYGDDAYVILASGSPAPKSTDDWYWQCEIACPGYIKEGDPYKFRNRYAIIEQVESFTSKPYPKLVAWRDGHAEKCDSCGYEKETFRHTEKEAINFHEWKPMRNEVENFYKRVKGLVKVWFKKDCLDLPAKIYRQIVLKPSTNLMRAARMAKASSKTAIQAMTLLRELSDGFQYKNVTDQEDCHMCYGTGDGYDTVTGGVAPCSACVGTGSRNKTVRQTVEIESPKLGAVTELLEENEEYGRCVFYAGFTSSIDRLCAHVKKLGWEYIRIDGRGWHASYSNQHDPVELLKEFQNHQSKVEKLVVIGHPGSAGMGLTLTRSSMIVYVSNTFNAEERIQSEDRCHRPGMDVNRGCTIVDIFLLPTDAQVYENLRKKRILQSISLGELDDALGDTAPILAT